MHRARRSRSALPAAVAMHLAPPCLGEPMSPARPTPGPISHGSSSDRAAGPAGMDLLDGPPPPSRHGPSALEGVFRQKGRKDWDRYPQAGGRAGPLRYALIRALARSSSTWVRYRQQAPRTRYANSPGGFPFPIAEACSAAAKNLSRSASLCARRVRGPPPAEADRVVARCP